MAERVGSPFGVSGASLTVERRIWRDPDSSEDNALNIKLFCDLLAAHGHEPEAIHLTRTWLIDAGA